MIRRNDFYILYLNTKLLVQIAKILTTNSFFFQKGFMDAWACHFPERGDQQYQVNYLLLNLIENRRIILRVFAPQFNGVGVTNSLVTLFAGSNWVEREMWDLFGIFFNGHPDLRRILTDYGFEGFPLRKDFPINGYYELRFNFVKAGLVYQPLKLTQDFRKFNFQSPWV